MTEHAWSQEQIAAHLAGGLTSEETERLDQHAKECPDCAAALTSAKHFDRGLGTLFAPLRPKPGLEDRAIQAFRAAPPRVIFFLGWPGRVTAAAAAIIAMATFGALAASIMADGRLPMPGEERRIAEAFSGRKYKSAEAPTVNFGPTEEQVSRNKGMVSDYDGAVPNLNQLAQKTVDDIVTNDPIGVRDARDGKVTNQLGMATDSTSTTSKTLTEFSGRSGATKMQTEKANGGNGSKPPSPDGALQTWSYNGPVPPGQSLYSNGFGGMNGGMMGMAGGMLGSGSGGRGYGGMPTEGMGNLGGGQAVMGGKGMSGGEAKLAAPDAYSYFVPGAIASSGPEDSKKEIKDSESKSRIIKESENLRTRSESGDPKPVQAQPPGSSTVAPIKIDPVANPEPTRRVVLRSGDIEFEVESFDSALAAVTKLVTGIKGAFVGTVNSEKLPNGKVRGSVTVRTPPEFLDGLVLDLRKELGKGGELKSVKLASQDVTKQYTDLESRLKAARAMETRLLEIIKTGKGEIKQLLEAERELGNWRTKIEEAEGELRYFANLAALSTLTITLTEKEIRAAVGVTENERVQAGVEVEDVDKAYQAVLKEVLDAKGRVIKSELKQLSAGQFNATLNFEVAPAAGGPIRDRLRQLGRVARLEIDRQQQAEGTVNLKEAKVTRGDTLFLLQLYNLANIAPRETASLSVAVPDVPTAYNALRDAIAKSSGRVQVAQLNEQDKQNVTAQIDFDVKRTDEAAIRAAITAAGEATARTVGRAPESDAVTDTKLLYRITLYDIARIKPRDTVTQQVAVANVSASFQTIRDTVQASKGRILSSQLDENDKQNVNASLDFEVRRTEEAAVITALEGAGETVSRQIAHAPDNEAATDSKVLYRLKLLPANHLKPRETDSLGIEVADVDATMALFIAQLNEAKGRQIEAKSGRSNGKTSARLVYEVPLAAAAGLVERFKSAGLVRVLNSTRDSQAPEGKSATARIDVTIAGTEGIVSSEESLWTPVKKGLTYSASFLLTSMTWVVFALCVLLPWAVVGYGIYRVAKRVAGPSAVVVAAPIPPASTPPA